MILSREATSLSVAICSAALRAAVAVCGLVPLWAWEMRWGSAAGDFRPCTTWKSLLRMSGIMAFSSLEANSAIISSRLVSSLDLATRRRW